MTKLFLPLSNICDTLHIFIAYRHGFWACQIARVTSILSVFGSLLFLVVYNLLVICAVALFPPEVRKQSA
jgi:hypothetical protein